MQSARARICLRALENTRGWDDLISFSNVTRTFYLWFSFYFIQASGSVKGKRAKHTHTHNNNKNGVFSCLSFVKTQHNMHVGAPKVAAIHSGQDCVHWNWMGIATFTAFTNFQNKMKCFAWHCRRRHRRTLWVHIFVYSLGRYWRVYGICVIVVVQSVGR